MKAAKALRAAPLLMLALAVPPAAAGGALAGYDPPLSSGLRERLAQADLAAGARFFERKCSQCHDGAKEGGHAKGPHLWNVMGRKAGTIAGFAFSDAMRKSGHIWNFATLDHFLSDTGRAVPGKAMNFAGIPDEKLRAGVVMHLRTLNDAPPPLP